MHGDPARAGRRDRRAEVRRVVRAARRAPTAAAFAGEGRARPRSPIRALRLLVAVHRAGRGRRSCGAGWTPCEPTSGWPGSACSSGRTRRTRRSGSGVDLSAARQRRGLAAARARSPTPATRARTSSTRSPIRGRGRHQHERADRGGDRRQERPRARRRRVRGHAGGDAALPVPAVRERRLPARRRDARASTATSSPPSSSAATSMPSRPGGSSSRSCGRSASTARRLRSWPTPSRRSAGRPRSPPSRSVGDRALRVLLTPAAAGRQRRRQGRRAHAQGSARRRDRLIGAASSSIPSTRTGVAGRVEPARAHERRAGTPRSPSRCRSGSASVARSWAACSSNVSAVCSAPPDADERSRKCSVPACVSRNSGARIVRTGRRWMNASTIARRVDPDDGRGVVDRVVVEREVGLASSAVAGAVRGTTAAPSPARSTSAHASTLYGCGRTSTATSASRPSPLSRSAASQRRTNAISSDGGAMFGDDPT